jgi:hypothetical protein
VIKEILASANRAKVVTEWLFPQPSLSQIFKRSSIKALLLKYHPEKSRIEQVPRRHEELLNGWSHVLKPGSLTGEAERHIRILPGDPKLIKELVKIGVIAGIADDESGIHGKLGVDRILNNSGVRVATEVTVSF